MTQTSFVLISWLGLGGGVLGGEKSLVGVAGGCSWAETSNTRIRRENEIKSERPSRIRKKENLDVCGSFSKRDHFRGRL